MPMAWGCARLDIKLCKAYLNLTFMNCYCRTGILIYDLNKTGPLPGPCSGPHCWQWPVAVLSLSQPPEAEAVRLSDVQGFQKSTEISILLSLNIYKYHRLSHLLFRHHQNVLVGTILLSLKSCLLSSLFCLPRVNGTFRPLADSS